MRGDVFHQRFEFLVIHPVDFIGAHAVRAGEGLVERHRRGFDKRAVLEMAALGGDLADVDFRVEIGGEGLAVVAAVHVDDVERVDFVEMVLERPGGEHIGHAGVETGAEQGGEPGFFETLLIGPLPGILELRDVLRLVVRGVHVVAAGGEAGVHEVEILIGQGHVDEQLRAGLADQFGGFRRIVGVHLGGGDGPAGALFHARRRWRRTWRRCARRG